MEFTQEGLDLLMHFEGCSLRAYKCPAGVWTIGYGTTEGVTSGMLITPGIAETMLLADVREIEECLNTNVACPLNENEYSALICLIYNIGMAAFKRSKLLRVLNKGQKKLAAQEFLRWNRVNKEVSPGLKRRREAEKELFLKV